MTEYDSSKRSQEKRRTTPSEFGSECPNCGEPFDSGATGYIYDDEKTGVNVRSWVRLCTGPPPEFADAFASKGVFCYIHKDEHIDIE